ncbi:MAG: triose-phosphate isomerase [Patescibacteria group bacterium]|nr:triose-phosphate isomerase [Patescibacteria group bacterium]
MAKKTVMFNWKMNPPTIREAEDLARASDHQGVVVIPPSLFLKPVADRLTRAKLGAQDAFYAEKGAFTGEVSVQELKDLCVEYVLAGHSERRHTFGEGDALIAKKTKAILDAGLTAVLCVGETEQEKRAGRTREVLKRQIESALSSVGGNRSDQVILAYEPVWAIGTGNPETPEDAAETIEYVKSVALGAIRRVPRVLYGGSVDGENIGSFFAQDEIDGALVGGASLKPDEISKMISVL